MTHICVSKLASIGSDNGLSPGRWYAIIWPNAGKLIIDPLGNKFNEILIKSIHFHFQENEFENVVWKMAAILSRPECVSKPVIQLQLNNMICSSVVVIPWTCVTLSASCNSFYLKKYDLEYLLCRQTEALQKASKSLPACSLWCFETAGCQLLWSATRVDPWSTPFPALHQWFTIGI